MKPKTIIHEDIAITDKRKAYEEKFDAQFKTWSAEISLLKAEAEAKITGS